MQELKEPQVPGFDIDIELLREFERGLDPRHPEAGAIPAHILGYGEISTVFEIGEARGGNLAYKRMPIFREELELDGSFFVWAGLTKRYTDIARK